MNRAERRAAARAVGKGPTVQDTAAPTPPPDAPPQVVAMNGVVVNVAVLSNGTATASVAAIYGPIAPPDVVKALQAAAAGFAQQIGGARLVAPSGAPLVS